MTKKKHRHVVLLQVNPTAAAEREFRLAIAVAASRSGRPRGRETSSGSDSKPFGWGDPFTLMAECYWLPARSPHAHENRWVFSGVSFADLGSELPELCTQIRGAGRRQELDLPMNEKKYPEQYIRLQRLAGSLAKQIPGQMAGFGQLHRASLEEGRLSKKIKELMALSIAIYSRCEGCVAYHVHDALKAGAEREEVLEAIGVALMMGGGPSLIYGCEALEALEQFGSSLSVKPAA